LHQVNVWRKQYRFLTTGARPGHPGAAYLVSPTPHPADVFNYQSSGAAIFCAALDPWAECFNACNAGDIDQDKLALSNGWLTYAKQPDTGLMDG
jgi:hypothetical protein